MSTLDAIILGLIQGLTEFLPVSSSGHLKLAQYFLGLKNLDHYILFDIGCHLGTLCAIFIVFFGKIRALNRKEVYKVMIATLPLFPLVLLLKPIKAAYADPALLGFFFLMTAAILFLGIYFQNSNEPKELKTSQWKDPLYIGLWQALAILPGVSRSGSTISGARILGWNASDSVSFSFLMAIPAILGATVLEGYKMWKDTSAHLPEISLTHYGIGFFVSFFVGIFALRLVIKAANHNRFSYFAWYCLFLGLATTAYFHL